MKHLKEISKWRDAPRAGRLNIVKMPLPPNLICGFCTISTQIPVGPFVDGQTDPTVPTEAKAQSSQHRSEGGERSQRTEADDLQDSLKGYNIDGRTVRPTEQNPEPRHRPSHTGDL